MSAIRLINRVIVQVTVLMKKLLIKDTKEAATYACKIIAIGNLWIGKQQSLLFNPNDLIRKIYLAVTVAKCDFIEIPSSVRRCLGELPT